MTKLSVNVNKVATLRNTRNSGIPSVVHVVKLALDAGAHGITVHPRPDQRHIRPHDVFDLAAFLSAYPNAEFNIEGNPFDEYMEFARQIRPTQCTLVPDTPDAFTSNQGWNVRAEVKRLKPLVERLKGYGCRVSLFVDPDLDQIERVPDLGADRVELYTEPFAVAFSTGNFKEVLDRYAKAARKARDLGLGVNAGHDLNCDNLPVFLHEIPFIAEVSIGHALIADALEFGTPETVRRYLTAISGAKG